MTSTFKILFVDDSIYALENFRIQFKNLPYETDFAEGYDSAIEKLQERRFNLLVTDLVLPYKSGLDIAKYALENNLLQDIILITGYGDEKTIEEALKLGFKDFIRKPYEAVDLKNSIEKIYKNYLLTKENEELRKRLQEENKILRHHIAKEAEESFEIIGKDKALEEILRKAQIIGKFSNHCLIQGESGTGKELLARYIHLNGARKDFPFIPVNCAELSPSLFESELFGYMKGAFTGANETKPGLFEIADNGILFLDEISEIPPELQAKLLRVIEYQKVRRLGDNVWRKVDVQVIASTNRSLEELSDGKIIRNDLFHRIATLVLSLPPLRKRKKDIHELVTFYHRKYCKLYDKNVPPPSSELLQELTEYEWKGNIRELSNFMKSYVLFYEEGEEMKLSHWLFNKMPELTKEDLVFHFAKGTIDELEEARKWLILKILKKYNFNQSQAARHLGMSYVGLHKYLKKIGALKED